MTERKYSLIACLVLALVIIAPWVGNVYGASLHLTRPHAPIAAICVHNPLSDAQAALAKKVGVEWIRVDVNLFQQSYYRFSDTYAAATKAGLKIIGILDHETVGYNTAFTLDDWKAAVSKAQSTFTLIHVWEIWNEPTGPKFKYGYQDGTPQHYFDMLAAAYTILKARDRNSIVLGIGGAQLGDPGDLPFTKSVLEMGGGGFMDAIAIHAYPYELNVGVSWDAYEQLWMNEIEQYRQFGKPLWLTETGLRADQFTESDQTQYLSQSFALFTEMGISTYSWYLLIDDPEDNGGGKGLLRPDLTTRPAFDTYASILRTQIKMQAHTSSSVD